MRRRILVLALVLGASVPFPAGAASRLPVKLDPDVLSGPSPRAIVGFDHAIGPRTIRRLAAAGIVRAAVFDAIRAVGVWGPPGAYRAIAGWNDVTYVDDDSPIRLDNYAAKKDTRVTKVRAGSRPLHRKYTGKGVTVAIIDTGIDHLHPDLSGRVVKDVNFEPAWVFDEIDDGVYSDRIAEGTGNPVDSFGHGTHVAGIAAGTGAAGSGADFSGVAPGTSLVNLKIADVHQTARDIGWEVNALAAYEWAVEHRRDPVFPGGIRIVSNSWGIYEADSEVEPITLMVAAAARRGFISVFAAGNSGPEDNTVDVGPNRLEEVITVAAACKSVDSCGSGNIAGFSSRGPQVDVAAPGANVYSTMAPSEDGLLGGHRPPGSSQNGLYYMGLSGTSMATPHVSGVIALMLEANLNLTLRQVQQILATTAQDEGPKGFDHAWGHGLVDAFAAVKGAEQLRGSTIRGVRI
jgi:serine protease AprX